MSIVKEDGRAYLIDRNNLLNRDGGWIITTGTINHRGMYQLDNPTDLLNWKPTTNAIDIVQHINVLIQKVVTTSSQAATKESPDTSGTPLNSNDSTTNNLKESNKRKKGQRGQRRNLNATFTLNPAEVLHNILGHLSLTEILWILKHNILTGLQYTYDEVKGHKIRNCGVCQRAKATTPTIYPSISNTTYQPMEYILMDIILSSCKSADGYTMATIVSDFQTEVTEVYGLSSKSEVLHSLTSFINTHGSGSNPRAVRVRYINADSGSENLSKDFIDFIEEHRIQLRLSSPYRHEQSLIERRIRTIKDGMRVCLFANRAPRRWWLHAMRYYIHTRNRQPKQGEVQSRLEALTGIKQDVSGAVPFYSIGYVTTMNTPDLYHHDLDPRAQPCRMLGYAEQVNHHDVSQLSQHNPNATVDYKDSYIVLMPNNKRRIRYNVRFEYYNSAPSAMNDYISTGTTTDAMYDNLFNVENGAVTDDEVPNWIVNGEVTIPEGTILTTATNPTTYFVKLGDTFYASESRQTDPNRSEGIHVARNTLSQHNAMRVRNEIRARLGQRLHNDDMDDNGDILDNTNSINNNPDQQSPNEGMALRSRKLPTQAQINQLIDHHLQREIEPEPPPTSMDVPQTLEQAFSGPDAKQWYKAWQREIAKCERVGTYSILPTSGNPANNTTRQDIRNTIKSIYTLRLTMNPDGSWKYKVRLCACGYSQTQGVNYNKTFAPTAKVKSIRTLINIAAANNWDMEAIDIENAFLESELTESIHMYLPYPQHQHTDGSKVRVKLNRSLYGLKQAGHAFYHLLRSKIINAGFTQTIHDQCVFIKTNRSTGQTTIIATFVDDIMITGSDVKGIAEAQVMFIQGFTAVKQLGPIQRYLGVDIVRNRINKKISLSQHPYVKAIQPATNKQRSRRAPLDNTIDYRSKDTPTGETIHQPLGKLRYLGDNTEPSILNPLSELSSAAARPNHNHIKGVQQITTYVGNHHTGLTYGGDEILLFAMVDAAYISRHDSKSQLGYALFLNLYSGTIHARSKKDSKVSLSSTEAEIHAIKGVITEIIWARGFLADIGFPMIAPTLVYTDSYSSILMCEELKVNDNSKHILVDVNFINQHIQNGTIALKPVDAQANDADILTKNLPPRQFIPLRTTLQHGREGKAIIGQPRLQRTKPKSTKKKAKRQKLTYGN